MPVTRRGVYHNLKESKYVVSNGEITFFFSSKFYMNKFMDEHKDFREIFNKRAEKTFIDLDVNLDLLSDISFYKITEKRGFRVKLKGDEIGWKDLHLFVLETRTNKSISDWYVTQKPKLEELRKNME